MHHNQHNLFETPIWGFVLHDQDLQSVDYTDYIISLSENETTQSKSNMGGWQSRDNIHTDGIFQELNKTILVASSGVLKDYTNREPYIQSMWANINNTNDHNAHHLHEGQLSGVFYCQVPKNSGKLVLSDPRIRAFQSVLRHSDFSVDPERLVMILFPSWLEHYVQPNKSQDPRISISFNIEVK